MSGDEDRWGDVTRQLNRAAAGDPSAARAVMPLVYRELRRMADSRRARAGAGETLRTTALVHEAYLRVVQREPEGWAGRSHFFFAAARAMRDILVEDARRRSAPKHGGALERVPLDEEGLALDAPPEQVLALQRCVERLESQDSLGHQVVMLRFFIGMTMPEIAEIVGAPLRSVERKWSFVRAWLATELAAEG